MFYSCGLLTVFVCSILNMCALSNCRPQKNVTTIADLSYGFSSFDLARVIIYECKTQTGLTAYDRATHSLSSKFSAKSDEKIGIVRVGTRVRYRSSSVITAAFIVN